MSNVFDYLLIIYLIYVQSYLLIIYLIYVQSYLFIHLCIYSFMYLFMYVFIYLVFKCMYLVMMLFINSNKVFVNVYCIKTSSFNTSVSKTRPDSVTLKVFDSAPKTPFWVDSQCPQVTCSLYESLSTHLLIVYLWLWQNKKGMFL